MIDLIDKCLFVLLYSASSSRKGVVNTRNQSTGDYLKSAKEFIRLGREPSEKKTMAFPGGCCVLLSGQNI